MSNPFKCLLPRATMTHAAFEQTLLRFEKVRLESEKSGKRQIGGLLCDGGEVGVWRNAPSKKIGDQRATRAGAEALIRYLKKNGKRFDQDAVSAALTALRAVKGGKGENIDLTRLAEHHHGLMDTSVLTTDFGKLRRGIRDTSNQIYRSADSLTDGSFKRVGFQSPETAKATEQGMKDKARLRGKRFGEGCLPGVQQTHPKDAKRLFRWLGEQLGVSDLTRSIEVDALDRLPDNLGLKLNEQKVALERLIAQAGSRDQDPEFHAQIKLLSEKYMTSQAVYCHMLAFVANVLVVRRNPIDLPPDFRLPVAEFAQSLLNLLDAQLASGSDFMENNRWAAKAKAEAEKRLSALGAPEIPVATQDTHAQQVDRLKAEASKAYADFEAALLNGGQTPLRGAIAESLKTNPATENLPLAEVRGNLFDYLPGRIREQYATLRAEVLASEQSGHQDPLRLKRIRDVAHSLDQLIEGYLAQLDAVSSILLTDHRVGDLPEDLDKMRRDAGHRMQQLRFVSEDPSGELKRIQTYAKQNKSIAENALNVLGMKPGPEVRGTRPLESKPARAYESFSDAEVDEMMAELTDLHAASFTDKVPGARQLPTTPIRAARQVGDAASPVARHAFRQDWDLGYAVAPKPTPWRDELESALSGIDEAVKTLDRTVEIPLSSSVQRNVANVSVATPRGPGELDNEGSQDLSFSAEEAKRPDAVSSWRPAAPPSSDPGNPARTNRLAPGREANAVRMDKAANAFRKSWGDFVNKCLVPADGLSGLSAHQRLVKDWWSGLFPKTSYDPATHNADADMPLAYLAPGDFADLFVSEWPRNLEARRQELKDLLFQKESLKDGGADVRRRLNDRIQKAANSLEKDLRRYVAQVDALAKSLIEQKGFPVNVPPGFKLATAEAGKSLSALSEVLKGPMARAHRLVQDARERSAVAR